MKPFLFVLFSLVIISQAFAFRGGGGGGFRGGGVSVGVGMGGGGARNVNVGVGVRGTHGSVYAHRSAAMGAYYHPYTTSYWGWYGYAPYHYYYPTTSTYSVEEVKENKSIEVGSVVAEIPENCKTETFKGINYKHCGDNWFQPQFSGTELEYVRVETP